MQEKLFLYIREQKTLNILWYNNRTRMSHYGLI